MSTQPERTAKMKYIAFYKSDAPPGPPADMKGMDELVTRQSAAGKFVMGGGFLPAEQGLRVRYAAGDYTVKDGAAGSTDGVEFIALNGGPVFKFNEAVSLSISCRSQAEVDHYWSKLTAGGAEGQCGWLKDKYGVSWQVVPLHLTELMASTDSPRVKRMTETMFKMKKLDIATLEKAFNA